MKLWVREVHQMSVPPVILAQPLAFDCIGLAILFLVILALLHGLSPLRNDTNSRQPSQHHLHDIGHRLHELKSHRHH
jgi:hypothetical protein